MGTGSPPRVTELLLAWGEGDQNALDKLVPLVQLELHRMARNYMGREAAGHALQTTELVDEVYLRLIDQRRVQWQNRAHFFGISARLMRQILVDMARSRRFKKRAGEANQVSLDHAPLVAQGPDTNLVALDDALTALAGFDERKAQIVELRFFGGLSVKETAEVLKISTDTVTRDWVAARAWLYRELKRGNCNDS